MTFFAVREEIAEKLREIPEFLKIYTPLNSVGLTEMSQVTPSAHVNFAKIDFKSSAGKGGVNQMAQRWAVAVVCRNAKSQIDARAVTDEAGLLVEKVIQLLGGWQPKSSRVPLVPVGALDGYSSGFAYITIIFESQKFI